VVHSDQVSLQVSERLAIGIEVVPAPTALFVEVPRRGPVIER
jgi:hypothetical protein